MTDIVDWFKQIPIFTRYWFGLTVATCLLARFSLIPGTFLVLDPTLVFKQFQVSFVWAYVETRQ